jgi:hypothetical protein
MELFSYILFQSVHCWCTERLLIFVNWFCILLLCWSFYGVWEFLMEFFGCARYKIMLSENRDSLTSSLLIYIPFISPSCLTALPKNSNTMLNRSGESEHPCVHHTECSPFGMILASCTMKYCSSLNKNELLLDKATQKMSETLC